MTDSPRTLKCPACECQITIGQNDDPSGLTCPHCQADLSSSSLQDPTQIAEEIAPGFRPGQKLGNYIIDDLLGAGGMAVVFRGTQVSLNRPVAIKVLPKHFVKKQVFLERFESEATALASLNHPNIVSVIDRGVENDVYFIVMEYIQGDTLKERLAGVAGLVPDEICDLCRQTLRGLEYAHKRGVIHRDIKPGNLIINRENVVKIADFGLAHLAKSQGGLDATREGQSMGTLKYMAPEQLTSAKRVDGRADLYSFGVCLYEMLTGKLPLGAFKRPSEYNPELDARWDDIIVKVLRMEPDERYRDAAEMARAIREIATSERVTLSEREAREESLISREAEAELVACPQCGHVSDATATQCEKCTHPLADIFEKCPGCNHLNRLDIPVCISCGADLEPARMERRRQAEAIQTRAKELAREKDFDAALLEVGKLMRFTSREYAGVRASAQLWIERIKEKNLKHQSQVYEAGARCVAERNFERALHLWRALPDTYKDVGARRKQILAQRDQARAALAEGRRCFHRGEFENSLKALEQARAFWPNDKKLADYLVQTRNKIGNHNLKKTYLAEAREARKRGDIIQTRTLCQRVLHLDPEDSTALGIIEEMETGLDDDSDFAGRPADLEFTSSRYAPRRKPAGPSRTTIALFIAGFALVVLVLVIILAVAASSRADQAQARNLLRTAAAAREDGDLEAAEKHAKTILSQYPDTAAAQPAQELLNAVYKLRDQSHAVLNEMNLAIREDTPAARIQAYHLARQALNHPAVRAVKRNLDTTRRTLEILRGKIAEDRLAEAETLIAAHRWREAVALCQNTAAEFQIKSGPLPARLQSARAHLRKADELLRQARGRAGKGEWRPAAEHCKAALNLIPTEQPARDLLAQIAPHLTPPEGMVHVPAGTYALCATDHRPQTAATFPFGFFIHSREITRAQYARFLAATNHPPPSGWPEDGLLPKTEELLPVTSVTWRDAKAYARWAQLDLPTESQWEAAAAGPQALAYPWGNTYKPAAVLAYNPAPVGAAVQDRSPVGCLDMAGNVAEWTDTPVHPASQPQRYIVKGSSWAGPETDRLVPIVPAPAGAGPQTMHYLLAPDPQLPDLRVISGAGLQILYLGISGTADYARIHIRLWQPQWCAWAEKQIVVRLHEPIRFDGRIPVVSDDKGKSVGSDATAATSVRVTLETGCVLNAHQPNEWIEIRNPFGLVTRLPRASCARPEPIRIHPQTPAPATDVRLPDATRNSARMTGQSDLPYLNVGFRCSKQIWTPPPPGNRERSSTAPGGESESPALTRTPAAASSPYPAPAPCQAEPSPAVG